MRGKICTPVRRLSLVKSRLWVIQAKFSSRAKDFTIVGHFIILCTIGQSVYFLAAVRTAGLPLNLSTSSAKLGQGLKSRRHHITGRHCRPVSVTPTGTDPTVTVTLAVTVPMVIVALTITATHTFTVIVTFTVTILSLLRSL